MRQASWNEMFAPRSSEPLVLTPEVPQEPRGWRRLLWWEDLLTLGLVSAIFLTVVGSIDSARWVDDMPWLYPIGLFGLIMGALLSRVRWPEGFIHLFALPVGAAAVLGQILAVVPGPHPVERFQTLTTRMGDWFDAAFTGGISQDSLPFIASVVALTWLGAYLSSWAVFRWQNAWLALIPGGTALLMNISYLPGQFSFAFVIFLFGGALLVTRLHLMQRAKDWREHSTPYPPLLSLSVLHATFWLAFLLVGLAWLLPQANEVGPMESLWRRATAPATERVEGLSRLFVSVGGKQGSLAHRFGDTLPFQGSIELSEKQVLEVISEQLEQPYYLRADVYDIYLPTGWKQSPRIAILHSRDTATAVDVEINLRRSASVRITSRGRTGDTIFSLGQPQRLDRESKVRTGAHPADVLDVEKHDLQRGDEYQTAGSISVATEEDLRAAGTAYPDWVRERYLQLPSDFPPAVRQLAWELTRGLPTRYDRALAIEGFLRNIPHDLSVPDVPVGEDATEFFLFEAERGYFDYHASAMVVMLRSIGIPARLAVGYVLRDPERGAETDRYAVTERDAFAWPEVYFAGLGWVEFNPTPNLPAIERPGAAGSGGPAATEPAPNLGGLPGFPAFPQPEEGTSTDVIQSAGSDRTLWVIAGVLGGLAALLASVAGGVRYAWVLGFAGLDPPARLWGQTVRLASWARLPLGAAQTPREYARSLRDQVPGVDDVDRLADAYVRHRFGRWRPAGEESPQLEQAWRVVRGRLLRHLFRLR